MKLPSLTNATLTKVEAPGFLPDYQASGTVGSIKFTGAESVLFLERIEQVGSRSVGQAKLIGQVAESNVFIRRSLVVSDTLGVPWGIDDVVTVDRDGTPQTGTVRAIQTTGATGYAGVVRLVLDDA